MGDTRTVDYLTVESLLQLVVHLEVGPVRDVGLLASAAARPQTTVLGDEAYPDLPTKAAALLHSLAHNHQLVDGNKRLAWLSTVVFLDLDDHRVDLSDDQAFDLVMEVSSTPMSVEEIAARLAVTRGRG